jgi:16S rRNA (guanine527-N7)-methyltransferase
MLDRAWGESVSALAARFRLPDDAARLAALAAYVADDPHSPTSVREPRQVVDRHLADSLVALELEWPEGPFRAVDIGSGAGFPGLPLAIARPESEWALLESNRRKCEFIAAAAGAAAVANARAVNARAEAWTEGLGRFDVAAARAVGRLDVLIEYAAPLLAVGGRLIAWRGHRDPVAERAAAIAADELGMELSEVRAVAPFPGAETRNLHVISKTVETPSRFPRRVGVAAKRPLGERK